MCEIKDKSENAVQLSLAEFRIVKDNLLGNIGKNYLLAFFNFVIGIMLIMLVITGSTYFFLIIVSVNFYSVVSCINEARKITTFYKKIIAHEKVKN